MKPTSRQIRARFRAARSQVSDRSDKRWQHHHGPKEPTDSRAAVERYGPLGWPHDSLDDLGKECWLEIAERCPWLCKPCGFSMELAARQLARFRRGERKPSQVKFLRSLLVGLLMRRADVRDLLENQEQGPVR